MFLVLPPSVILNIILYTVEIDHEWNSSMGKKYCLFEMLKIKYLGLGKVLKKSP